MTCKKMKLRDNEGKKKMKKLKKSEDWKEKVKTLKKSEEGKEKMKKCKETMKRWRYEVLNTEMK